MSDYRLLILDENSGVLSFETFTAADDQHAWQHIRTWFSAAYAIALWCGARRVDLIGQQVRHQ